ncbi:P-loop containing nucleoside triphosphate hydrolase protein [Byssothecium circinans]|uniref:P-loop containing nucleoside triphosphate hydrolase protein n=1 Tax=Byssothecium circinans TaxID=147558 RepID=A0A6A5TNT1_9PLEO|nr:P-loop containing nucleoside triphosphate hydrolase protein [Byssothecium circinans]
MFEEARGYNLNSTPPVATPELMFHARTGLKEKIDEESAKAKPDGELAGVLCAALQYFDEDFGSTLASLKSLTEQDEITFKLLWTLFPPETIVYTRSNMLQEDQLLICESVEYKELKDGSKVLMMDCRLISHDGVVLGWLGDVIKIEEFEGAKKVQELKCFPFSRHAKQDEISARLLERGKRFTELSSAAFCDYKGQTIGENTRIIINGRYKPILVHVSGRIMLDPVTFYQQNTASDLLMYDVVRKVDTSSMTDEDFLFCDHKVPGFSFRQKLWCLLAVSNTSPIVWNEDAFSKLVLEPKRRALIHTLVKSHRNANDTFDDVVSGKGRGLVGLLSGNPGVGKTLTAEVVAEVTKRPLYMLSAGELGTDIDVVEAKLDTVLEITRLWGCVLLIDEADVFLQERDIHSLQRNALVSIFLRRLEYFQGVLLLTTNRKSTIDTAFESRIHFKLHYPDLTAASRLEIWQNCLAGASAASVDVQLQDSDLQQLAEVDINGRQIKNAVACAVSVALQEKKAVTMEGVEVMLGMIANSDEDQSGAG